MHGSRKGRRSLVSTGGVHRQPRFHARDPTCAPLCSASPRCLPHPAPLTVTDPLGGRRVEDVGRRGGDGGWGDDRTGLGLGGETESEAVKMKIPWSVHSVTRETWYNPIQCTLFRPR